MHYPSFWEKLAYPPWQLGHDAKNLENGEKGGMGGESKLPSTIQPGRLKWFSSFARNLCTAKKWSFLGM